MQKLNFTIRLDADMRQWLDIEAKKQNRTVANLICYILMLYRNNQGSSSVTASSKQ